MERNARIILVSVFLVLSLAGLYLFYQWIDSNTNEANVEERLMQFQGSVSGLSIGSEVRYLGVPVGRVTSIKLTPERAGRVDVMVGAQQLLPDSDLLVAMLEGQGITGLSIIELRDRRNSDPTFDAPAGVVPGLPSMLSQLSDSAGSVTERAAEALARINTLLSTETISDLQLSIEQIRIMTTNIASATADLGELTSSITRLSQELEKTVPDYRAVAIRLEEEVLPAVTGAGNSLQAASDAITSAVGENSEALQQMMNRQLPTLIGMTDQLADTLEQLSQTVESISEEPGSLLFGKRLPEVEIRLE